MHLGKVLVRNNDLSVINCADCQFAHLYPLPDAVDEYYQLDRFYQEHSPPDWMQKETREHQRGYWESIYTYQSGLIVPPSLWKHAHHKLIDWGAGSGWFTRFWNTNVGVSVGIEPSQIAHSWSPIGSVIVKSKLDLGDGWKNSHIRLALVLEHVRNPSAFLKDIIDNYLGPDKRIMIVVPNEFNPLQRALKTNHFVSNVHVNYFTPISLERLLNRVGLRVSYQTATFPTEIFPLIGFDFRNNPQLGRKCHLWRLKFEKRFPHFSFRLYKRLYDRFGWGRELVFVAHKKA